MSTVHTKHNCTRTMEKRGEPIPGAICSRDDQQKACTMQRHILVDMSATPPRYQRVGSGLSFRTIF
jgi:hypothetical protein